MINQKSVRMAFTKFFRFLVRGMISIPAKKKRTPANCKGVVYCNPILIPAKAVDQSKQAMIAKKYV